MNAIDDVEDATLLSLAEKISEGTTIDASEEQQRAPQDADRDVLNALLDIAAIEAAHRDAERSFDRMNAAPAAVPGQWVHLTILEKIGEGEYGEVYRAHDGKLQIDVALKLSAATTGSSAEVSKILSEARLLAKVRHPNVVRIYGADYKHGRVGLWMDLVQGRTLAELTKTQGFGAREAIGIGIELCRALAAVHAVGLLHGDIKAHNVIRQDGGQIVLVDFGCGRPLAVEPDRGHDVIGTPVYMAPEVLNDESRSTASDIYSLGVLLFHLVTGDYPVYARSRAAFIEAHKTGGQKRLRDLRPDLPDGFIQVVERATAIAPHERFGSAGALESALVRLQAPEPAPPPAWQSRDWLPWLGVGAAVVIFIAALALWTTNRGAGAGGSSVVKRLAGNPETIVAGRPGSFDIDAAFYRVAGDTEERLTGQSRLRVNDQVHLSLWTSSQTYLYVVNEDEKGNAILLFPLPAGDLTNPLPANTQLRLPNKRNWVVNSAGGKEHLIVIASTEQQAAFEEDAFKKLAAPVEERLLPPNTVNQLRGFGRLAPADPRDQANSHFRDLFMLPLVGRETANGLWGRQLTMENTGGR